MSKAPGETYDLFGVTDTPFEEAVRFLFRSDQRRYRIDPAVTAYLDPVTFRANDAKFDQLLTLLLAAVPGQKSPLTFRVEKGVYIIAPKSVPVTPANDSKPIGLPSYHPQPTIRTVSITDERPGAALAQMFAQAGVNYAFVQPASVVATPRLTFNAHDVPLEQAVVHLLRTAPTEPALCLQISEKQVLASNSITYQTLYAVTPDPQANSSASNPEMHCWFSLHNSDLYTAIRTLMTGSKQMLFLNGPVPTINVTVSGSDLPLEQAISKLLAASPVPMQSHTEGGMLYLEPSRGTSVNGGRQP